MLITDLQHTLHRCLVVLLEKETVQIAREKFPYDYYDCHTPTTLLHPVFGQFYEDIESIELTDNDNQLPWILRMLCQLFAPTAITSGLQF